MLKQVLRYTSIVFIAASVMVAFTTFQVHLQMMLRGQYDDGISSFLWNVLIWYSWLPLLPFAIVITLRYPIEKGPHFLKRITLQFCGMILLLALHALIAGTLLSTIPDLYDMPSDPLLAALRLIGLIGHWGVMMYVATIALVHVFVYMRKAQTESLAREAMRTQAAAAQLSVLQKQMQPHFLFNSLNALVSMLEENSPPQRFTIRLADMLRSLLENSDRPTASLAEEIAVVNAYLEIERARLGSRLRTDIDVIDSTTECRLPSLTLQPLVENAIRHSISRTLEGGEITVHARRELDNVRIDITNTCVAHVNGHAGTGVTLPNCRQRLALMYGPQAKFDAGFTDSNLFRATIILPAGVSRDALAT